MASPSTTRDPQALLRAGAARHAAGDLAAAERLYRQVLKAAPQDPNAHNLLGVLARQRGDVAGALRHTERALAQQPETAIFLANRGAALAEAGRLAEAVAALRAALARRPEDAVTLRNLGQALCALGDAAAALAAREAAARLLPAAPEPQLALAHARREAGDAAGAAAAAEAALARSEDRPELAAQAEFLLAALGRGTTPARAPAAYVRDLFDQFAPRFEAELTGALGYATPALLAGLLAEAGVVPARALAVLDLGCGTGLSGVALAPLARRLEGLDLSPRMLAEARRRGLYHALHEADLLDWLPGRPGAFGLVAAADVLNYLGDLGPALAAIAGALVPGGWAAFSVEAGAGAPFALGEAMRFRHDPAHVLALAAAAGLAPVAQREASLRTEKGRPVAGALFVLSRR
ncbi:tetratricopeptide repeat protein [Paeniroseomonas aquatica]|uniref:Tetratricopeptide repeat protein n=1 Tax=Paeniroseomonas aquatica TaxID=373043 RepID=A0ABT8A3X7_9PROT|nr:tetratricopeptide repeat protein [Paeniroseomonas aquatica]MDN3564482.1 tetratricopeptide repeat protein [Paeniroseomonas aquatica]